MIHSSHLAHCLGNRVRTKANKLFGRFQIRQLGLGKRPPMWEARAPSRRLFRSCVRAVCFSWSVPDSLSLVIQDLPEAKWPQRRTPPGHLLLKSSLFTARPQVTVHSLPGPVCPGSSPGWEALQQAEKRSLRFKESAGRVEWSQRPWCLGGPEPWVPHPHGSNGGIPPGSQCRQLPFRLWPWGSEKNTCLQWQKA